MSDLPRGPVLALDAALNGCAAAVYDARAGVLAAESRPMARGQAEMLVPMIGRVMAAAETAYTDLALIAVTAGPGAFTGLRIGLATAQAFGQALGIPVAGVTTTRVLAAQFRQDHALAPDETLAVILETKRDDFYAEFFGADPAAVCAAPADELIAGRHGRVLAIGDALPRFAAGAPAGWRMIEGFGHPDPAMLAALACDDFAAGRAGAAQPVYLRPPDVTASKKPLRRLAAERPGDA